VAEDVGHRLRSEAQALWGLVAEARAAVPERVSGADGSGAVRVFHGPAGPDSIVLDPDWRRRLPSADLGAAVVAASQAAAAQVDALAWERVSTDRGWLSRLERLDAPTGGTATDLDAAIDHVARAATATTPVPAALTGHGTGTAALGRVVVTVTDDRVTSCEVGLDWVSGRPTEDVSQALATALADARADLTGAADTPPLARQILALVHRARTDPDEQGATP